MLNFVDFRVGRKWALAEIVEWNGIFREFQFSGILAQPLDIDQNFRNEFPELSVPFDFVPEFPEILVQWIAPRVFLCCCIVILNRVRSVVI